MDPKPPRSETQEQQQSRIMETIVCEVHQLVKKHGNASGGVAVLGLLAHARMRLENAEAQLEMYRKVEREKALKL